MKSNKLFFLVVVGALTFSGIYSFYEAFNKDMPIEELKHKEKMAEIEYKKEKLGAKVKEKKAKVESKYEVKKAKVRQEQERAKADLEKKRKEAQAEYTKDKALSDIYRGQNDKDLMRYKSMMYDIKSYK